MEKLFVVTDVRVVPGKGLVLTPVLREVPSGLDIGAVLEMCRPDGGRIRTRIVSMEHEGNGVVRICVPMDATIGPGTEVWFEQVFSGFVMRATGLPATGPINRPRAVPAGLRIAGGDGRRR
jgi:hypothetical protein